jgi:hypothetical protein
MNLATHGRRRAHSVCSHQAIDGSRKECTSPAGALGFADLIPRRSWAQRQVTAGMVPASPLEARERVPTMRGRIQMREANAHGAPSLRRQRRRCLEGKQRLRCATRCRTRSTVWALKGAEVLSVDARARSVEQGTTLEATKKGRGPAEGTRPFWVRRSSRDTGCKTSARITWR